MQYSVLVSNGEMSERVYDSSYQANRELERINAVIAQDSTLADLTARIVTREVEAGEWND
jgi:hypothetical protein